MSKKLWIFSRICGWIGTIGSVLKSRSELSSRNKEGDLFHLGFNALRPRRMLERGMGLRGEARIRLGA